MEQNETQSSLQALFFVLRRRLILVIAVGIAVAMVFALATAFLIKPKYASTAKFYVNNTSTSGDQQTSISSQDISASQSLAESSIVIVRNSTSLLKNIIKNSGVDVTVQELRNNLTAGTYSGTEAFYITVEAYNSKDAYKLAQAFYEILPGAIPSIIKVGDVSPFDSPIETKEPVSPNLIINTLIGGFIGFAVAFLAFFLKEVLDNTVYSEEDIKDKFGYPIIGVIPTIHVDVTEKSSAGKKRRA